MSQVPKGRLVENPLKPIYRDCAMYFSVTVYDQIFCFCTRFFSGKAIWTLVNFRVSTSWGICISLHLSFNSASLSRVNHQRLEKHRSAFFWKKTPCMGEIWRYNPLIRSGHNPPQKTRTLSIQKQFYHKAGPNIKAHLSGVNSSMRSNIRT